MVRNGYKTRMRYVATKESLEENDMSLVDVIIEISDNVEGISASEVELPEDRNSRERIAFSQVEHNEGEFESESAVNAEERMQEYLRTELGLEGNVLAL